MPGSADGSLPFLDPYARGLAGAFASVEEEVGVLTQGCGVALAAPADELELLGEDRERFLNGLVTCDVRDLKAGEGRAGFFTERKGRILSDLLVWALEDRLVLQLPEGLGADMREHLSGYVIADRVEIGPPSTRGRLLFQGPESSAALAAWVGTEPPAAMWSHAVVTAEGHTGILRKVADGSESGAPAWALTLAPDAAGELWDRWDGTPPPRVVRVGREALESLRVEAGQLLFGVDFGRGHFPQESGREGSVSYEKGCYLGQEVVARIHYRGGVNRLPRGLLLSDGGEASPGALLRYEGQEVGQVTSRADSVTLSRPIGLTVIHRNAAEPGTVLEVEGGGGAEVAELPLVRRGG